MLQEIDVIHMRVSNIPNLGLERFKQVQVREIRPSQERLFNKVYIESLLPTKLYH